ncbi:Uncharacterised protein [Bacteroides heparinolyticus]|uniref:Uncharacterized protein n=1 Tax=Prevotella heparinolytica TaxID=28113 RepID=A0A449I0T8_9BACE|nr:Uncharacterised protein [Bacteroides heparinolyticus]
MDTTGANRISVPKASFLGEEEGVPRCGTTCSSVPDIRHLEEKGKRRVLSTENQANTHSSSKRDTQTVYCHVFSTSIERKCTKQNTAKSYILP